MPKLALVGAHCGYSWTHFLLLMGKTGSSPCPSPFFLSAQTLPQGTLVCGSCRQLLVLVHLELGCSTST